MIEIMEVAEHDFKTAIVNMFKDIKQIHEN